MHTQVRCLEDIGEIATEEGSVQLEKGSQHFLRRSDVEPLIRAGKLEHIA
jgi:GINS complex subunit 1